MAKKLFSTFIFATVASTVGSTSFGQQQSYPFQLRTPSAEKLTCAQVSDDVCNALWSEKNNGAMTVFDGIIRQGLSKKSEISRWKLEDLRALIDSEPRLPLDLQPRAKKVLKALRDVLKNEKDNDEWYRSLGITEYYWDNLVTDIASARTKRKHPAIKHLKQADQTLEQKALFKADLIALQDEVVTAKYAQHKNWKRVEKVFAEAKKDVVAALMELNLPEVKKKRLAADVQKVALTLPFLDPNKATQKDACSTTLQNAYYSDLTNKVTVCAGTFNTYQSEASLYGTLAHEISHSVDSYTEAVRLKDQYSAIYKAAEPLGGEGYGKMTCDQWQNFLRVIQESQKTTTLAKLSPLQPLYECLSPKEGMKIATADRLAEIATNLGEGQIDTRANDHSFLYLAQPIITKLGKQKPNEYFMRPDRLRALDQSYVFITGNDRTADIYDVFTQALTCEKVKVGDREQFYVDASLADRAPIFDHAMTRTTEVIIALQREWFNYCGTNCAQLVSYNLSKDSTENFADWLEYKALGKYVARLKDVQQRREALALASVDLCDAPGVKNDAPDLAPIEKRRSFESHPEHRLRRIAAFNKLNAELADCAVDAKTQGFGVCEL